MSATLFLLDTSVLLYLVRGSALAESIDESYGLRQSAERPLVSRVTHGEIRSMARRNRWGARKLGALENALSNVVTVEIQHPAVVEAYVVVDNYSQSVGRPMGQNDLWIAACAKASGATLLTTDGDFRHLDPDPLRVECVDPAAGH